MGAVYFFGLVNKGFLLTRLGRLVLNLNMSTSIPRNTGGGGPTPISCVGNQDVSRKRASKSGNGNGSKKNARTDLNPVYTGGLSTPPQGQMVQTQNNMMQPQFSNPSQMPNGGNAAVDGYIQNNFSPFQNGGFHNSDDMFRSHPGGVGTYQQNGLGASPIGGQPFQCSNNPQGQYAGRGLPATLSQSGSEGGDEGK